MVCVRLYLGASVVLLLDFSRHLAAAYLAVPPQQTFHSRLACTSTTLKHYRYVFANFERSRILRPRCMYHRNWGLWVVTLAAMQRLNTWHGSGGFIVSAEMQELIDRPGFLPADDGGSRLRSLYQRGERFSILSDKDELTMPSPTGTAKLDPRLLSDFAKWCFMGDLQAIKRVSYPPWQYRRWRVSNRDSVPHIACNLRSLQLSRDLTRNSLRPIPKREKSILGVTAPTGLEKADSATHVPCLRAFTDAPWVRARRDQL